MENDFKNISIGLRKPDYISQEYTAFQLIKICKSEKYLNDFVSGKLYMSTLDNISKIENKELTKGQHDTLEGTEEYWQKTENNFMAMDFTSYPYLIKYFDEEPTDKDNLVEMFNVEIGRHKNIYKNIFCMYSMWFDTLNKKILNISPKIIDNFGEYSAIIIEPGEFIQRFQKAIINYSKKYNKKYNTLSTLGFVEYVNFKDRGIIPLGTYRKNDFYVYQNEFRFCLGIEGNKEDLCYFEIGDLSDIVNKVKTVDLVYNTKIEGDYLIIGNTQIDFEFSKY